MTRLHSNPPFHAEHVGSILRPKALLEKRAQFEAQQCTKQELVNAENDAIAAVVKLQQDCGMRTITDGEMRRTFFFEGMFENLEGMTFVPNTPIEHFKAYLPYVAFYVMAGLSEVPSTYTTGKIKRTKGVHTEDFKYLKSCVKPEDVKHLKVNMLSPIWLHLRHGPEHTYDHSVYKNDDEYFRDLIQAYREEINELYELGCRNIQIDDPSFCFFCAQSMLDGMTKAGVDHAALLDKYISWYNVMTRDRPDDLVIGVHMCRGNYKGLHYCEGGYEAIAKKVFVDMDVDCFYLEYDDNRAGSFEPLQHLPLGKVVVLGLVTTKNGVLESASDIKSRVEEAVEVMVNGHPERSREDALKQISVSPQCGFASTVDGNPISEEEQRLKLELVVSVARMLW
ncbi:hypothetical protein BXZ70DRAFT_1006492 [Cristinia sonorae]|uniref:Cobalamin-independent methionine synthase MetE C-terminal/archaeal domain-containing protein n=1 Tax=Cristinia sonorae TaxID=1940300 RepID=A0A8K0US19_9AGAR|nr:hypothetical protein BXZ70DRAFT_1006492 [Cristinia sonorae]